MNNQPLGYEPLLRVLRATKAMVELRRALLQNVPTSPSRILAIESELEAAYMAWEKDVQHTRAESHSPSYRKGSKL